MYRNRLIILMLVVSLFLGLAPAPAMAESNNTMTSARDTAPLARTLIELRDKTTTLTWGEEQLEVSIVYELLNPTNKKIRLPMTLPYVQNSSSPTTYYPLVSVGQDSIKTHYNSRSRAYNWDLTLEAGEELTLVIGYSIPSQLDQAGLVMADFVPSPDMLWAKQPAHTTMDLQLKEINPGQIKEIQPSSYKFQGNYLTWTWSQGQAEQILVKADILSEKKNWQSLIPHDDRVKLNTLTASKDYLSVAELFRVKVQSADRETRLQLKEAQAYYLDKAGQTEDAKVIWEDLYEDKSRAPRVYWAMGQTWQKQNGKILELYQRVKELQISPLLQDWLATQLPPNKLKPLAPENLAVAVNIDGNHEGLILNVKANDKDGDIEKVVFRYHWEDQKVEEKVINLKSFQYEHTPSLFIPSPGPLKRLFYEVIVFDKTGNQATTSEKEDFYLNNQLVSNTSPLLGAMLVLADYTPSEQDKVYKWFLSYVKMANEADFVPVEQRRPYFIFLGQSHAFISEYHGPLFIMHTPTPFSPTATRLNVHRYFLSYWYGPGWNMLPEAELGQLGDALMLGKGRHVMVLKYLAEEDPKKFADLLGTIGQGRGWPQALTEVYQMNYWEAQARAVWFAYGNMVIAVFLIIGFAWLGKAGQITRMINYFREK